jgi:EAL domain-containing protein (putative c-di-GMP-specific phosphodiesterase class I)
VQAVVNIAAASDLTTTAKGVETEQQKNLLSILGCTEMQGFLFSPGIPRRRSGSCCVHTAARPCRQLSSSGAVSRATR